MSIEKRQGQICHVISSTVLRGNLKEHGYDINNLWRSSDACSVRRPIEERRCGGYELEATNKKLARKLKEIEKKVDKHDKDVIAMKDSMKRPRTKCPRKCRVLGDAVNDSDREKRVEESIGC